MKKKDKDQNDYLHNYIRQQLTVDQQLASKYDKLRKKKGILINK